MPTIELITAEVCPYAQRTHMTLIEKGLDFGAPRVSVIKTNGTVERVS